jgi:hypothetical protein
MPTLTAWTTAVATVMPVNTGRARNRVANAIAISCDLSPSSATKMTAKLRANAPGKPSVVTSPR